tara:strand:+ start:566 stop:1078 length:513 start_codon:yes stop_codon:yes gene_type:complete
MKENRLARIRNQNLDELNLEYDKSLNEYTDVYQKYLENITGNDDDISMAEEEFKPKVVNINTHLIKMTKVLLENNKRSGELIEKDYKLIGKLKKDIVKMKSNIQKINLNTEKIKSVSNNDKVKIEKKVENLMIGVNWNKNILLGLTILNIILLTFLILSVIKLHLFDKTL